MTPQRPGLVSTVPLWRPSPQDIHEVLGRPELLQLVGQPIIDLEHGAVVGYEVLSRFPRGTPDQWFQTASSEGLAASLDAMVVRRALDRLDELPPNTFMTVNVEPHSLLSPEVRGVWADAGSLERVVIELTEHSKIRDIQQLTGPLADLRRRGAMIAADDVGAGYSGLQLLLSMRPQIVKVDRGLVDGIDSDPAKRAVVRMLGELSSQIDAWVLAEGIEREQELVELIRLGVPLAQGYLLSRPHPDFKTSMSIQALALIRAQSSLMLQADSVGVLMDVVPLMPIADNSVHADGPTVIEVDAWGRPVAVVTDGVRTFTPLTAQATDDLKQLAARMVGRVGALAPAVVVDGRGRAQGILGPRRVMTALAEAPIQL